MRYTISFGIFLIFFCFNSCASKPKKVENAVMYLAQYGYLAPNSMGNSSLVNAKTFKKSLKEFQAFAGIPKTGKLDKLTLEVMSSPRCGVSDKIGKAGGRTKRYVTQGSKWPTKQLTYRITKYTSKLSREEVDKTIQDAFNLWSKYTDLTFERSDRGKINIRFEERNHGDGNNFDGPGGTLAHAYFPQYGGATHFDDAEPWIIGDGSGINLLQTAAHEFGHALGLSHSQIKEALMAPFYKRDWTNDLYRDDIAGIQRLYGAKSGAPDPGPDPAPGPDPDPAPAPSPQPPRSFPGFPRYFPRFPGFPRYFPGFPRQPRFFPGFPSSRGFFPSYNRVYRVNFGR